jgi:CRP-like cAMP-binding protein
LSSDVTLEPAERLLAGVPLFAGLGEEELNGVAQVLQRLELQVGDVLCRQGEETNGLHVILAGAVGVYSRLPGGREIELATLGAGEVLGELSHVDDGLRTATVRALEPTSAVLLGRAEFVALLSRLDPIALTLNRRITAIVCERLRRRCVALAGSLADGAAPVDAPPAEPVAAPHPDERYLLRLPCFRAFTPGCLAELLELSRTVAVPAGRVLLREGVRPETAYVTCNGAVEEVLARGTQGIRVRLAGPGRAVGYLGLVDGGVSPVTVATRERALLLEVPAPVFDDLFADATPLSHAFLDAVQRDAIAALRQAERPQARLAVLSR